MATVKKLSAKGRTRSRQISAADLTYYRLLIATLLAAAQIILILLVNRSTANAIAFYSARWVIYGVGGALFLASAAYLVMMRLRGRPERRSVFSSYFALGVSLVFFLSFFCLLEGYMGSTGVILFILSALLLCYIKNIFTTEFFFVSCFILAGAFVFYFAGHLGAAGRLTVLAVGLVICAAEIAAYLLSKRSGGNLKLGGEVRILSGERAEYIVLLATAGLTALAAIIGLILPAAVVYFIYMQIAILLGLGIYYTVKTPWK